MSSLKITLVKSVIGAPESQRRTVRALGLRKLNHSVLQPANRATLGAVRKVLHLVRVEEVTEEAG